MFIFNCRGIGFSICHRLLIQLSYRNPPDTLPQPEVLKRAHIDEQLKDVEQEYSGCEGLTVIMACRNAGKAESARKELLQLLDEDIAQRKKRPDYDGWAEKFRENVQIDVGQLDLASMSSVFKFAEEVKRK